MHLEEKEQCVSERFLYETRQPICGFYESVDNFITNRIDSVRNVDFTLVDYMN
jgi:hypothetical protein